jgi:hypothetical protein
MNDSGNLFVASRKFSQDDQINFANFSGDYNPIHTDPVIARRTITGQCVVHGMHGLMWALELLASKLNLAPSSLRVSFTKPIFLDEEVICFYNKNTKRLKIMKEAVVLFEISLKFDSAIDSSDFDLKRKPAIKSPIERDIYSLKNLPVQDFFYRGDINLASISFPNLTKFYGVESCCEMAAISEIVGMQAPGLYSFFLSAHINFQRNERRPSYSIENVDDRFNLLKIAINATSLVCSADAFIRQKPIYGASLTDMQSKVDSSEFRGISALVIGGSRGLGECAAKLIALGGGASVITYSTGYEDCLRVSNSITAIGGKCSIAKFKIPDDLQLIGELGIFNQIYYFPTPKIFGKRSERHDQNLYNIFYEMYVGSFKQIVEAFSNSPRNVSILYPSSIAIDNRLPELAEYIDAKIAGENLCRELNSNTKNITILVSRMPRTKTDQTMSLIEAKSENAEDVMLPLIRKMISID